VVPGSFATLVKEAASELPASQFHQKKSTPARKDRQKPQKRTRKEMVESGDDSEEEETPPHQKIRGSGELEDGTGAQVEAFVVSWSRYHKKELHYTFTNSFQLVSGPALKTKKGLNLPYEYYNAGYSTVDHYNRLLNDKSWKTLHCRKHYILAADDFYFSCLLVNSWIYFMSINKTTNTEETSFSTYTKNLSQQIF